MFWKQLCFKQLISRWQTSYFQLFSLREPPKLTRLKNLMIFKSCTILSDLIGQCFDQNEWCQKWRYKQLWTSWPTPESTPFSLQEPLMLAKFSHFQPFWRKNVFLVNFGHPRYPHYAERRSLSDSKCWTRNGGHKWVNCTVIESLNCTVIESPRCTVLRTRN